MEEISVNQEKEDELDKVLGSLDELDTKINNIFEGCVVIKPLVKKVKGNAVVPSYVLEYLLGQYCVATKKEEIEEGIESVQAILQEHYVHRNDAMGVKAHIKEKGSYRVIDMVKAELDDKHDCYRTTFSNLGIDKVIIDSQTVYKKYPRLLVSDVWCLADIEYQYTEDKKNVPWILNYIKPIQLAQFDFEEFSEKRSSFTTDEWIDLIIKSIGFNPNKLSRRNKLLQMVRLIPFCERNYNLVELGPKGTGKSHIYTEFSPHGTLISGGEVSVAKLFVSNSKKHDIGLVGYWDNVTFDEFAGSSKKVDKALVDIMKGYMANKSFSRGTGTQSAEASMTFIGNTKHNVPYMLKHSNLFEELPPQYLDSAFLDRLHFYIPGWEIDVIRNDLYATGYGFIVDYYAEALKALRDYDYSNEYQKYFELSQDISTRDQDGIRKTFSGLMKIIYPDKKATAEEIEEILKFAIEGRKRVKDQILRIDTTLPPVDFSYQKRSGEKIEVKTLEEVQYGNIYAKTVTDCAVKTEEVSNVQLELDKQIEIKAQLENEKTQRVTEEKLEEGHIIIEENQTGITYENLFGKYIKGVTRIHIEDPYIRQFHQMVNLMELLELIEKQKDESDIVEVELITSLDDNLTSKQDENLATIRESCFQMGIEFTYEYNNSIHARSITTDNGWKILLDRGLDIYQNCERKDVFQFTTRVQKYRPCKRSEITYIKQEA